MTAVDDLITDLQQRRVSTFDQFQRLSTDKFIAALQQLSIGGMRLIQTDIFTAAGVWNKPAGAVICIVEVIGGGGGGGSGAAGTNAANRGGGAGGNPGAVTDEIFSAADLPSPVNVVVGAAVNGGPFVTGTSNGNPGTVGNPSSFGTLLFATGGTFGNGGAAANVNPQQMITIIQMRVNSVSVSTVLGGIGQSAANGSLGIRGLIPSVFGGPGGGGGGAGLQTTGATHNGGDGGAGHNANGGGNFQQAQATGGGGSGGLAPGNPGLTPATISTPYFGDGGGGGSTGDDAGTIKGGDGGNGGSPGGGGGGGGGCRNTQNSGRGGTGARGEVRIWSYG